MMIGYEMLTNRDYHQDLRVLREAGCQKIYTDPSWNRQKEQPGLEQALLAAKSGDALIIRKLDRLGKNLTTLLRNLQKLTEEEVKLIILEESLSIPSSSKATVELLATLIKFQEQANQSQREARISKIRRTGAKNGRPKALGKKERQMIEGLRSSKQYTVKEICERMGISRSTFYNNFPSKSKENS